MKAKKIPKSFTRAVAFGDWFETWESQGWLNQRQIYVYTLGRSRFRSDTQEETTARELKQLGFKRIHRVHCL